MPRTKSASPPQRRRRFVRPLDDNHFLKSYPGGLGTLASIHPPRWARPRRCLANNQVVPRRLGDAGTNPSSSLSPKRRGHASLLARPGLHHQPSWTTHLTRPARRECVRPCSDTLSLPSMPPTSWRPFRQWEGPCVSSLFLSLGRQPVPPRATTTLGLPPAPRLARHWPEWDPPKDRDPLEVLAHPAVAGVVDGTASDCLPT